MDYWHDVPLSTSRAWRLVNGARLQARPAYSVTFYDEYGEPLDPLTKTRFHSSYQSGVVGTGWDGDDGTSWSPGDQGGGYEAGTVWLGLSADEAFHVSRFRVHGSQDNGLVVLQKLVSGDPPADAAADSGVWRDVATAALSDSVASAHALDFDSGGVVGTRASPVVGRQ